MKRILIKPLIANGPFYEKLYQNEQRHLQVVFGLIAVALLLVVIINHIMKPSTVTFARDEGMVLSSYLHGDDDENTGRERMAKMDGNPRCNDSCNFQLVESLPWDMPYGPNSSAAKPLYQAWMELLNMTQESIHVASYYWTLTGEDVGVNDTSSKQGEHILNKFESLLLENISVFIATNVPSKAKRSTDLEILERKGAHIKRINFGQLTHGVLHTKFWIVDRKHIFLGSANVDWRALTQEETCVSTTWFSLGSFTRANIPLNMPQRLLIVPTDRTTVLPHSEEGKVKEVGVLINNCSSLANDLWKTFRTYWDLGEPNATIPSPWPSNYSTNINRQSPLEVQFNGTSTKAYFSASPSSFCPDGRTFDLIAVLDVIYDAEEYVYISMMEYFPTSRFSHPPRYWPPIDNALKSVALSRNVQIRLLVSCWIHTDYSMFHYLKSLSVLSNPSANITIEVKIFIVPIGNHTNIPFARLNHNKYMVTEKTAYVGTSNWAEEYFTVTAGVGLITRQSSIDPAKKTPTIQEQLRLLFERDWNSRYSISMEDLPGQKDCAWKDRFVNLKGN